MALLLTDDFEDYGSIIGAGTNPYGVMTATTYPNTTNESLFRIAAGVTGYAVNFATNGYAAAFISGSLTTVDTVVLGFSAKFDSLPALSAFADVNDNGTRNVRMALTPGGEIATLADDGSTYGTTSGAGITTGVWKFIEMKVKTHATLGTIDIQVDGVNVLSLTGKRTKWATHDYSNRLKVGGITGVNFIVDNLYFLDSSGATFNDFVGYFPDPNTDLILPAMALTI